MRSIDSGALGKDFLSESATLPSSKALNRSTSQELLSKNPASGVMKNLRTGGIVP
jgi:hypothetical protein